MLTPVVADWSTVAELSLIVVVEVALGTGEGAPLTVAVAVLDVPTALTASVTFR
jgi:hypothetical protein